MHLSGVHCNYNKQHKNLNNHKWRLLRHGQTEADKPKTWFKVLVCHQDNKRILQLSSPTIDLDKWKQILKIVNKRTVLSEAYHCEKYADSSACSLQWHKTFFVSDQCVQTAHSIIGTQVQLWHRWETSMTLLGHRYDITVTSNITGPQICYLDTDTTSI